MGDSFYSAQPSIEAHKGVVSPLNAWEPDRQGLQHQVRGEWAFL